MDNTTMSVKFKIFAEMFSTDEVTQILGVNPSGYLHKGEQGKFATAKETSWYIETQLSEALDINEHLTEIINILASKKKELIELKEKYKLEYLLSIIINIKHAQAPAVYFEHDIIKFLNDVKAEVDIDMYVL